jgi:hypothetical protein
MKIRTGFISNSSSTSFTFCIKGNTIKDLFTLFRKYHKKFDLQYDDYKINAETIIGSIKALEPTTNTRRRWGGYRLVPMAEVLDDSIKRMESIMGYIQDEKIGMMDYYKEELEDSKEKISYVKKLINKGFNTAIMIGFGDNDGEISGGAVGITMDYEGRGIKMNEPDFVIMTEQNR